MRAKYVSYQSIHGTPQPVFVVYHQVKQKHYESTPRMYMQPRRTLVAKRSMAQYEFDFTIQTEPELSRSDMMQFVYYETI